MFFIVLYIQLLNIDVYFIVFYMQLLNIDVCVYINMMNRFNITRNVLNIGQFHELKSFLCSS